MAIEVEVNEPLKIKPVIDQIKFDLVPLGDLLDVDTDGAVDGDVLTYDESAERWLPQSVPSLTAIDGGTF